MKIICFIKTIYRTLGGLMNYLELGAIIEGCDYVEQLDGTLVCEVCGRKSL